MNHKETKENKKWAFVSLWLLIADLLQLLEM